MKRGLILFLLCSSLLLTGCGKAETVAEEKAIAVTVQDISKKSVITIL